MIIDDGTSENYGTCFADKRVAQKIEILTSKSYLFLKCSMDTMGSFFILFLT